MAEPDLQWWQKLVGRATDKELLQARKVLDGEDAWNTGDYMLLLCGLRDKVADEQKDRMLRSDVTATGLYCNALRENPRQLCGAELDAQGNCPKTNTHADKVFAEKENS